jgi:hypothetical protein
MGKLMEMRETTLGSPVFRKAQLPSLMIAAALSTGPILPAFAQAPNASAPAATQTGKAVAPKETDLTGYWVSVVTEDWRWRMVVPAKGDYQSVPINETARKVADTWDPAKDEASGEQCRSYGAPAVMRVPGRLHISWQDNNTLTVEIDAGQQTRLLHFGNGKAPSGPATWQGDSIAGWETPRGTASSPEFGSLKVVTSHMRPGYLRKNGVPYSANTVMTEYWDVNKEPDGDQWLVVTTIVHDLTYLYQDWVTSLHFKKEPSGAKWDPQPCSSKW